MNAKISGLAVNLRKRSFELIIGGKRFHFPFSKLVLKPTEDDPLVRATIDPECANIAFTYHLASGKEDTVPADAVLEYHKDPEYERQMELFKLTVEAQKRLKALRVRRAEVMRRMGVKPAQFYRLIDQTFYGKTIDQMMRLFAALDCVIEFKVKPRKKKPVKTAPARRSRKRKAA